MMQQNASSQSKVVLITGASRGIGATLVEGFRARGYRVIANSRTIELSDSTDVLTVPGDIADMATRIIDRARDQFGRVHTLVNNAGIFLPKAFTDYTAEDFKQLVSTNLEGSIYITQLAVKQMLAQKPGGSVVSITVLAGR